MSTAELIFKYRNVIERMCKIKVKMYAVNGQWYEVTE